MRSVHFTRGSKLLNARPARALELLRARAARIGRSSLRFNRTVPAARALIHRTERPSGQRSARSSSATSNLWPAATRSSASSASRRAFGVPLLPAPRDSPPPSSFRTPPLGANARPTRSPASPPRERTARRFSSFSSARQGTRDAPPAPRPSSRRPSDAAFSLRLARCS